MRWIREEVNGDSECKEPVEVSMGKRPPEKYRFHDRVHTVGCIEPRKITSSFA